MESVIAIDAMGGDFGPKITVPAAVHVAQRHPDAKLILVGKSEVLETYLKDAIVSANACENHIRKLISIYHASEVVEMDDSPSKVLRSKKDSSMRVAVNLVKDGTAQACISAGNTGALMATAHYVLKTLVGVDRPAIIASFPTVDVNKEVRVLDLGANVESTAAHLLQFAVMGSELSKEIDKIESPKIGLLNIGSEEIKGNEQVKAASQLLAENPALNYIGYVEGDDIFKGNVDVVVCDGFIGNIALKTIEGAVKLIMSYMKRAFMKNLFTKLVALFARPVLKNLKRELDPGRRNGASLIGLRGIVIKSHGGANEAAFGNAIEEAIRQVEHNIPQKIKDQVAKLL